jgi:hypothetical protein
VLSDLPDQGRGRHWVATLICRQVRRRARCSQSQWNLTPPHATFNPLAHLCTGRTPGQSGTHPHGTLQPVSCRFPAWDKGSQHSTAAELTADAEQGQCNSCRQTSCSSCVSMHRQHHISTHRRPPVTQCTRESMISLATTGLLAFTVLPHPL